MVGNDNPPPLVIFLLGLPASGKSTLARRLAADLGLPTLAKDEIKEQLFDSMGTKDREWAKLLGGASFDLLYWGIEKFVAANVAVIVDVDFSSPKHAVDRLAALKARCAFRSLRINLVCDGPVLFERFKRRSLSGERHPGHVDHLNFDEFAPSLLAGRRPAIEMDGDLLEVDTTNLDEVAYEEIVTLIKSRLLTNL